MASTVAAIVIIAILAVAFLRGGLGTNMLGAKSANGAPRADGHGITIPGLVEARAKDDVCKQNLTSLRQLIYIYQTNNDDAFPPSLKDLQGTQHILTDPIDHEPYQYDPKTGVVKCVHPGHEKY
jgi:hypothetical protein